MFGGFYQQFCKMSLLPGICHDIILGMCSYVGAKGNFHLHNFAQSAADDREKKVYHKQL